MNTKVKQNLHKYARGEERTCIYILVCNKFVTMRRNIRSLDVLLHLQFSLMCDILKNTEKNEENKNGGCVTCRRAKVQK